MNWDDVQSFLAIARARSLSGAARDLGVRQSTMSRRLEALESKAGARLLQRTARGYELTPLGEAVLGNAERMEAEAIAVERAVQGRDVALTGTVRVTTVEVMADLILPPATARLQQTYPGITIDVLTDPRSLNLSRREADLAIRMVPFEGNDLVSRRIVMSASAMYASEAYLAAHGDPGTQDPGNGEGHAIINVLEDQVGLPEQRWLVDRLPRARVALRSNSRSTQLAAVREGLGLACLPCIMGDRVPGLARVTSIGPGPVREVWLGVHADLRHMPRIRAVIDVIDEVVGRLKCAFAGDL